MEETMFIHGNSPIMLFHVLDGANRSIKEKLSNIGYSKTLGAKNGEKKDISKCLEDKILLLLKIKLSF